MKPNESQIRQALEQAEQIYQHGEDKHYIAQTLLYYHRRLEKLEKVQEAASQYLKFGQDEHEHAVLLRAVEAAREQEAHEKLDDQHDFGL